MNINALRGRQVLVVEDEYLIAMDLCQSLESRGVNVIGPLPSVEDALRLIQGVSTLDGAILDINLHGKMVYPLADALTERRIPYIFATGYDATALPERYQRIPRCEKPVHIGAVLELIERHIAQQYPP
jgi:CheY-like chemotaxis protein